MQKIMIMSDSGCDIEKEIAAQYGIKILQFGITIGDISFMEHEKTKHEFYDLMDKIEDIPKTAQITPFEFGEVYKELYADGYTDVIFISISSTGSNTFMNSTKARDDFYEGNPESVGKFRIHLIDSKCYTAVYGYVTLEAAKKAKKGDSAESIVAYAQEWCDTAGAYIVPYTLKYARKSGRISAAAAFAGELLGLKPIIDMSDGGSKVIEKVRGEKNVIPRLVKIIDEIITPQTPYCVIGGKNENDIQELVSELTKKIGYKPDFVTHVGPAVASNSGNVMVGVVCKRKTKCL